MRERHQSVQGTDVSPALVPCGSGTGSWTATSSSSCEPTAGGEDDLATLPARPRAVFLLTTVFLPDMLLVVYTKSGYRETAL